LEVYPKKVSDILEDVPKNFFDLSYYSPVGREILFRERGMPSVPLEKSSQEQS